MKRTVVREVEWQDPPTPPPKYDWRAIAEQLRSEPMKWALVFERDRTTLVNALRAGAMRDMAPDLGFETRTTNNVKRARPRTCSLYARWNPDKVNPLSEGIYRAKLREEQDAAGSSD